MILFKALQSRAIFKLETFQGHFLSMQRKKKRQKQNPHLNPLRWSTGPAKSGYSYLPLFPISRDTDHLAVFLTQRPHSHFLGMAWIFCWYREHPPRSLQSLFRSLSTITFPAIFFHVHAPQTLLAGLPAVIFSIEFCTFYYLFYLFSVFPH